MTDDQGNRGHSQYGKLQHAAREAGRNTQEFLVIYAMEGFLERLAQSDHRDNLVLKGGMLLARFDARRPTRDIDIHSDSLSNDLATIADVVSDILRIDASDGLQFDLADLRAETIRDEDEYSGVRVAVGCSLHTAQIRLTVDVNVGDAVWPEPELIRLPRLLGGQLPPINGYPLSMVFAEKLVTAAQRGTANTRWRDFADVYLLTGQQPLDSDEARKAIRTVAESRSFALPLLSEVLRGYAELAQARWTAWRSRQELEDRLPASFAEVLALVIAFADPLFGSQMEQSDWDPGERRWVVSP